MKADELELYLSRMKELQATVEDIRREFGRAVLLDLETMGCLETLLNTMGDQDGWWDDLKAKPASELEVLSLMISDGWHPDKVWPDESYCDEMVYELVEEAAREALEVHDEGARPCVLCGTLTNTPEACFECYHQPYGVGWQDEFEQGGRY